MSRMSVLIVIITLFFVTFPENHAVSSDSGECQKAPSRWTSGHTHYYVFQSGWLYTYCDAGYVVNGSAQIRCKDGKWEQPLALCVKTGPQCEVLPVPRNGVKNCGPGALSAGKTCKFRCKNGFTLKGSKERTCTRNLRWTGLQPTCHLEQKISSVCSHPPPLANGTVINCGTSKILRSGDICSFKCNKGYEIQGPRKLFCRSDGKLSDENRLERYPTCVDVDECRDERLNLCNHFCHNTVGSYNCSCFPGFVLTDDYKCEGCRKNFYRSDIEDDTCEACPSNSYTETEGKSSIADCFCDTGFSGDPEKNIPCEDINECATENYGCSDTCVNTAGSAYCACPQGFGLQKDNKTCEDIDECSIKNGGCQGSCQNTVGNFSCSCSDGYTVSKIDRYVCDDIDECAENNGGCSQKCVNFPGGYYCSCEDGYHIDSNQKSCSAVVCPRVAVPRHSNMRCFLDKNQKASSAKRNTSPRTELADYPVGTTCKFSCSKGYKKTVVPGSIECKDDGKWSGEVPECRASVCPPLAAPKHGKIHPPGCTRGQMSIKQKCYFTCDPGYSLIGKPVFTCTNEKVWSNEEPPKCKPGKVTPFISCPEDITINLMPVQNSVNLTIPPPETNMENYIINPNWISVGTTMTFPAGRTDITFTVESPKGGNETTDCIMTVNVLDQEPPTFLNCPDMIEVEGATVYGVPVSWNEPLFMDNVGIQSIFKNLEPNTTLTPGVHLVEYVATDTAGNVASCSFEINITHAICSDLKDPENGEANCMDWMFGKMCEPSCNPGYRRHPDEPHFYTCDDSEMWSPADIISPCLKYFPSISHNCPVGFERRTVNDTGEIICLECQAGTLWSSSSGFCEESQLAEKVKSTHSPLIIRN